MKSKHLILSILSSLLLICSFPRYDFGFLAWVGLVPLLMTLKNRSPGQCFILSLVFGLVFFIGVFHWILAVPKYTLVHHAMLALYLGTYFALFGLGFSLVTHRVGITSAFLAAPFLWVSLEYLRSNLSFLSLPMALLAHSQYQYPAIIQIAAIGGTYSVSFIIVIVNSTLTALFISFQNLMRKSQSSLGGSETLPRIKPILIPTAILLGISLLYGYKTVSRPIIGKEAKISIIQGNIDQSKKWVPTHAEEIMQTYAELTLRASKDKPALIIWPETATPGSINQNIWLNRKVMDLAHTAGTYLLLGSAGHQKFPSKDSEGVDSKYMNSAFLINDSSDRPTRQRYDKIRLFPFGEYLPYKKVIPWSALGVSKSGTYEAGTKYTVFDHPAFRIGVTICWENVFPSIVRQFVQEGAQLIINITNEAHFGKTAGPFQLASISVFRAVENRVFVLRCANSGISCIIDPYGNIVDRVKDDRGTQIFISGILNGLVIPLESQTYYTEYGDWAVWISIAISATIFFFALIKNYFEKFSMNYF